MTTARVISGRRGPVLHIEGVRKLAVPDRSTPVGGDLVGHEVIVLRRTGDTAPGIPGRGVAFFAVRHDPATCGQCRAAEEAAQRRREEERRQAVAEQRQRQREAAVEALLPGISEVAGGGAADALLPVAMRDAVDRLDVDRLRPWAAAWAKVAHDALRLTRAERVRWDCRRALLRAATARYEALGRRVRDLDARLARIRWWCPVPERGPDGAERLIVVKANAHGGIISRLCEIRYRRRGLGAMTPGPQWDAAGDAVDPEPETLLPRPTGPEHDFESVLVPVGDAEPPAEGVAAVEAKAGPVLGELIPARARLDTLRRRLGAVEAAPDLSGPMRRVADRVRQVLGAAGE